MKFKTLFVVALSFLAVQSVALAGSLEDRVATLESKVAKLEAGGSSGWSCGAACQTSRGDISQELTGVGSTAADAFNKLIVNSGQCIEYSGRLVVGPDDLATVTNACVKN